MEHVPGHSCAELLRDRGHLDVEQGVEIVTPGLPRARLRAPQRRRAPRRQARQPARLRRRRGQARRLRHRPRHRPVEHHPGRLGARHRRLPRARAGARRGGRPARRPLLARRRHLPAALRPAALRGRHRCPSWRSSSSASRRSRSTSSTRASRRALAQAVALALAHRPSERARPTRCVFAEALRDGMEGRPVAGPPTGLATGASTQAHHVAADRGRRTSRRSRTPVPAAAASPRDAPPDARARRVRQRARVRPSRAPAAEPRPAPARRSRAPRGLRRLAGGAGRAGGARSSSWSCSRWCSRPAPRTRVVAPAGRSPAGTSTASINQVQQLISEEHEPLTPGGGARRAARRRPRRACPPSIAAPQVLHQPAMNARLCSVSRRSAGQLAGAQQVVQVGAREAAGARRAAAARRGSAPGRLAVAALDQVEPPAPVAGSGTSATPWRPSRVGIAQSNVSIPARTPAIRSSTSPMPEQVARLAPGRCRSSSLGRSSRPPRTSAACPAPSEPPIAIPAQALAATVCADSRRRSARPRPGRSRRRPGRAGPCSVVPAQAALEPAVGALGRARGVLARDVERRALVEHERDVRAQRRLDLHRGLGARNRSLPSTVGAKAHALLLDREDARPPSRGRAAAP